MIKASEYERVRNTWGDILRALVRKRIRRTATPAPEVTDGVGVANMLGINRWTVWDRERRSMLPRAISVSGVKRWRIRELRDWIDAGCPTPCVPPTWVWAPAERVSVRDYVHLLERKLVAIQDELKEMEQRAASGVDHVWVAKQ